MVISHSSAIWRFGLNFFKSTSFSIKDFHSELVAVSPYSRAAVSFYARKGTFAFTPVAFPQVVMQRSGIFFGLIVNSVLAFNSCAAGIVGHFPEKK